MEQVHSKGFEIQKKMVSFLIGSVFSFGCGIDEMREVNTLVTRADFRVAHNNFAKPTNDDGSPKGEAPAPSNQPPATPSSTKLPDKAP